MLIRRFSISALVAVLPLLVLVAAPAALADVPSTGFTAPASANFNTAVSFEATSPSGGEPITHYLWDFGDGVTASGASATHSYPSVGTFHVTLTAVDSSGDIGQVEHDIAIGGAPPTAAFIPDSGTVLAGSSIQFDGTPSSDPDATITSWNWSFGDGSSGSGAHLAHVYMKPGTFTVSLSVTDSSHRTSTISHQLSVIVPPPIQTMVETIVAAPTALRSGSPSVTRSGLADLGERLFCPGPGPACHTTITPSTRSAAYTTTVTVAPNSSFALVLLLSAKGLRSLRSHGRLPIRVTISSVRGTETTRARIALVLKRRPKQKG